MKKNIGNADMVIRLLFSVAVLILFLANIISGPFALGLVALSGILVVTVFFRTCPLYTVFGFTTFSFSADLAARNKILVRSIHFLSLLILIVIIHHFIARPWFLDWGAPAKIQELVLSGDHFTGGDQHTRAVLIEATPEEIWPWITQLGQERGGFYSYTLLENLILANMHNVYELRPELQQPRQRGDTIWLADEERYNGQGFQIIAQLIPQESFVMVSGDDYERITKGQRANGSWSIYLYPENKQSTWLIARSSGSSDISKGERFLRYLTFEVPHFIMEQKMLRTVKHLAEK